MMRSLLNRPMFSLMLCLALCCCCLTPATVCSHDLITTYRQAESTSPLLGRARALLQAEEAGSSIAKSALMPRVGTRAGVSGNSAHITGFGEDFITAADIPGFSSTVDKDYLGAHYSVTLTQPIVDGQAWLGLHTAKVRIRSIEAQLLAVEQELIVRVFDAYFGVLRARADHRVAVSQKAVLESVLEQAQKALQVGTGDIIDVQEAMARHDAADAALIRAQNEVHAAENRLEQLTHQPSRGPIADITFLEPEGPRPDRLEPWLETARARQPVLRQAREQLQAAQDQVELAQRSRWPKVSLDAGYFYSKGGFLPSIENNHAQVGINLSLPLYTGGEITARVRQAEANSLAVLQENIAVEDQVILNTRNAFLSLQDSVPQLRASRQALRSARVSLEATHKGFTIGTRTIVDVLNAVRDRADAERAHSVAVYNHVLARVQLKAAAGVLSVEDVDAVNSMLGTEDQASSAGDWENDG